jgi:hypothetical protein
MTTKYYIRIPGIDYTEIYPSNEPVIKIEQEPGEVFFRKRVDRFRIGKLKNPQVYALLETYWFTPASFGNEINYKININGADRYFFYDTIRAGNLDSAVKVYECTPEPDDDYKPIMRLYSKKYDNKDGKLFLLDTSPYYPKLDTTNVFVNDGSSGFNSFNDATGSVSYTNTITGASYAGKSLNVAAINGTVITVVIKNLSITAGAEPRLRLVDALGGTGYSNQINITANGKYELLVTGIGYTLIELSQVNLGASSSGGFTYEIYPSLVAADSGGHSLYNVLDRVINHASYFNLSYDIVSTILWNDVLESDRPSAIDTYMTAYPNNDYVTESAAIWNYVGLYRVDCFTTAQEDNIELCLKDIMDILKSKRLWWFIDSDGKFRIEHDKYFRSYPFQLDLTASAYKRAEVDRKKYSYDLDGYNQINIIEDNAENDDWQITRIEYDPKITGDGVKDIRCNFTTDIKNIIDNSASISAGGLVLLRLDSHGCIPYDESVTTPGTYYPNEKLSPLWIATNYMDYFAEAEEGFINGVAHIFQHIRETVKQTGVKFHHNTDLSWKQPFTMAIGEGWLTSMEYWPETGYYSINVAYNHYRIALPKTLPGTPGSYTADSTEITADSTLITADRKSMDRTYRNN